jgi:hypothetical protein
MRCVSVQILRRLLQCHETGEVCEETRPAEVDTPADGTKRTLSRGPIVSLSRPRFYLYFDLRDLPSDSAGRNARH